ncbi:MAG: glycoside hydrolase family 9 protein [Prolixibacteraceae bacterium]|nr:glycoside hydrolase family 9 protein [Prolixibacteraceae bacterium]
MDVSGRFVLLIIYFITILFPTNSFGEKPLTSKFIVIDQFGYRPESRKIAVIRDPQVGFDAAESFMPGPTYTVVKVNDSSQVLTGAPVTWNNGNTDASSGDKAWWFDFSSVKEEGVYYILDIDSNLCSYEFEIKENIFEEVLRQAVRTFFYQRSGFPKQPPYACEEWADGASHLQDKNARDFLDKNNAASETNVSGGWYDAGDYNKYTNWNANYIVHFMLAFLENPGVWSDDFNIPESGNNIPDILDETKWGLDHLLRMQRPDGSMLSVVGVSHASPPSSATGATYYGRANTSAALNSAGAFALASKVYRSVGLISYADSLKKCAVKAWDWAIENPNVIFNNNTGNTSGLAAGNQETDDYGRFIAKLEAAVFLYEITSEEKYKNFVENNYSNVHLMQWTFAYPFETSNQEVLLYYTTLPGVSSVVANLIKSKYKSAMEGEHNFAAFTGKKDPYMAHLDAYTWGSNGIKASQGLMYTDFIHYNINSIKNGQALEAAENYIHYLHGVNPLNMVYLSNMYDFGAENSVNEFYHSWFTNGSLKWDRVGESLYGPAPGFLTGGPNPSYDWDGCCPSGCGSSSNNAKCYSEEISPPKGQPKQKSYKDFNTSWPLNSWSITENSCGYQLPYIRLLARFIADNYDCAGVLNGTAGYDLCGICSGGTTGIEPETNPENCTTTSISETKINKPQIFPNPATGTLNISFNSEKFNVRILDNLGQLLVEGSATGNISLNLSDFQPGNYFVIISNEKNIWTEQFVKL